MKERKNITWEFKKLNTKDLMVDTLYQREIDKKRIDRIVKNYDPCLVNIIKVSQRNGKYYIFDGQHTSVVEKIVHGKGKDVSVDCKVFHGLTRLDEMELFVAQNGISAAVSTNAKYKALFNMGDEDVTGMVKAAECAKVRVDFTKGQAVNKVTALSTLMKSYLKLSRDQYIDMLSCLREAWDGMTDSYCREILNGMTLFYQTYYGEFKRKELSNSLSKVTPGQIVREAKGYGASHSAAAVYARLILRTYNTKRSSNRLEDKL